TNVESGTFKLTVDGNTTASINWDANESVLKSNIQNALNAAGVLGANAVTVSSPAQNTFDIRFAATGAQNDITLDMTNLASLEGVSGSTFLATSSPFEKAFNKVKVAIDEPTAGIAADQTWYLSIDGEDFSYVTKTGDDLADIATALTAAVNNPPLVGQSWGLVLPTGTYTYVAMDGALSTSTEGSASAKDVQVLTLDGADGGKFTLTIDGKTTATIAYSGDPAAMKTAIQGALNATGILGANAVTVTSSSEDTYVITFNAVGVHAGSDSVNTARTLAQVATALKDLVVVGDATDYAAAQFTINTSGDVINVVGKTAPSAVVSNPTAGVAGTVETQLITFDSNITGGKFTLSLGDVVTGDIAWSASDATLA
ncbi:MAG: hypothetical protein Q7V62_12135, partial [Actinomycetota bacterium]|nr:hypothetical protein [Actinomycetota bacterium]